MEIWPSYLFCQSVQILCHPPVCVRQPPCSALAFHSTSKSFFTTGSFLTTKNALLTTNSCLPLLDAAYTPLCALLPDCPSAVWRLHGPCEEFECFVLNASQPYPAGLRPVHLIFGVGCPVPQILSFGALTLHGGAGWQTSLESHAHPEIQCAHHVPNQNAAKPLWCCSKLK